MAPLEIDPSCEVEEIFGFLVGLLSAVFGLGVFLLMIDREGGGGRAQKRRKRKSVSDAQCTDDFIKVDLSFWVTVTF